MVGHSPAPAGTFADLEATVGLVPADVVALLGEVDRGSGREDLYRRQRPAVVRRLVAVARVQSAEASSALEGVVAPKGRLRDLMAERTDPQNRSEAEIAGYRAALDQIHRDPGDAPFTAGAVRQLHRELYRFTPEPGGRWKAADNRVEERHPDGTVVVVLRTVPAARTGAAMAALHGAFAEAWAERRHHRLILVGAYALDFLCIHPFRDGNGRMARLLTSLLLQRAGYEVGRYVSVEKLIEETRDSYYDTLRRSSDGWASGEHDPWPWLGYFLGLLAAAYDRFEERVALVGGRGSKTEAILAFVRSVPPGETFRVADVRHAAGGAGDSHISKVLARLRDEGLIRVRGRGRGSRWERRATGGPGTPRRPPAARPP